jgi:hypothetical protein
MCRSVCSSPFRKLIAAPQGSMAALALACRYVRYILDFFDFDPHIWCPLDIEPVVAEPSLRPVVAEMW